LIDEYNQDLLPEYLRFMQGVVDSEDLPLNVSRETIQSTGLMAGLKKVLTNQVIKDLEALATKEPEKYLEFWQEFGGYLKQGVAMLPVEAEPLYPLLRFKTNLQPETWSSLEEYAGRMKPDQKVIYYIVGEDAKSVVRSPHLDYFQTQGTEVLLLTEPMDSFMLMGLHKYKDFELKNVAQADLPENPPKTKRGRISPTKNSRRWWNASSRYWANASRMCAPATGFRNRWPGWSTRRARLTRKCSASTSTSASRSRFPKRS
jgi:molecular chaperone HtpG